MGRERRTGSLAGLHRAEGPDAVVKTSAFFAAQCSGHGSEGRGSAARLEPHLRVEDIRVFSWTPPSSALDVIFTNSYLVFPDPLEKVPLPPVF